MHGRRRSPATDALDLQKYLDATKPKSVDYRKAKTPKPPQAAGHEEPASGAKARPAIGHRGEGGRRRDQDAARRRAPTG